MQFIKTAFVTFAVGLGASWAESDCDTTYKAFLAAFPEKSSSFERYGIFCSNLARIENHNAGNARFTMGINEFSDWTPDEVSMLLGVKEMNHSSKLPLYEAPAGLKAANNIDWRSRMPAVKNQGHCGSCWAFSAIDVVDFYGGSHSEQQLLDCSGGSCQGYNSVSALQYLVSAGSDSESQYGYQGTKGSCHASVASDRVSNVNSLHGASSIQAALQSQVVSVAFELSEQGSPFMHYAGGVYDSPCGSGAGHAVAAVGYSGDYWIIRNSWGPAWGVGGYIYFKKGMDLCRLESWMPVTAHASGAVVV